MVSVIIAAHDEEAVIGACLEALLGQSLETEVEIIVSANGCTDGTAAVAEGYGVRVLDRPTPGKAAALNAADRVASYFPRVYLDADIVLPPGALERSLHALAGTPGALAAAPRRAIDTAGRPALVRAYFSVNERLPVFRASLFGRGMMVISEAGRARFEEFPLLIADDLFVDSLFAPAERIEVPDVEIVVEAPYRTKALLARLVRVRRGNVELRASAVGVEGLTVRRSDRWAWWRDVVRPDPRLLPAAVPYVVLTMAAGFMARRSATEWNRDDSSRKRPSTDGVTP